MASLTRKQLWIISLIVLLIPLGLFTKYYSGLAELWINHHSGGVLYEIFWCLLVALFFPQTSTFKIISIVFLSTCTLEILQLWHPPLLTTIRSTFIGHTILGSYFDIWDIPHYALGSLIAYTWIKKINTIQDESHK
ncbi:MAG: DUF2809 domain-containing protein [Candidatus Latescibacteria bacterium]|nr:DUF2809 domain-containing protein [Candidatus Latescibacterota bacterium]